MRHECGNLMLKFVCPRCGHEGTPSERKVRVEFGIPLRRYVSCKCDIDCCSPQVTPDFKVYLNSEQVNEYKNEIKQLKKSK